MKKVTILIVLSILSLIEISAQSAGKIMADYTEVSGGQQHWDQVKSFRVTGTAKLITQGMELPFNRVMDQKGRQKTTLQINGMDYIAIASDGKTVWGSNSQLQPEVKGDDESKNTKLLADDFPFPGHNWKKRAYAVELVGTENVEGIATYKIKVTKKPQWVNGKQAENVVFLYIDTKRKLPILTESVVASGPNQGQLMQAYNSDYRKVDGLMYPFVVTMKYDGQTFQILTADTVEWNAEIDKQVYSMPKN